MTGDEDISTNINDVQQELNDQINTQINMMNLTPRPGSVIYKDNIVYTGTSNDLTAFKQFGNTVRFPMPPFYTGVTGMNTDGTEEQNAKAELGQKRQQKMWVHFARMFVDRYEGWEMIPDSKDPLRRVVLRSKNLKYTIEDRYPMNEIALIGCNSDAIHQVQGWILSMTGNTVNPYSLPTIPTQDFYGWALGVGDEPAFITNPEA